MRLVTGVITASTIPDFDDDDDPIPLLAGLQDLVAIDSAPGRYILQGAGVGGDGLQAIAAAELGDPVLDTDYRHRA
jgi:hypothetical protein